MNQEDYIENLYKTFADAPRPERSEIAPHECDECDEVSERLSAHAARDVPDDDMHWLGDTLPLLGPTAFRYYLPRFIEFCIKNPDSSLDALINYNLTRSPEDVGERNRFAGFTKAEGRLILKFVELRAAGPDAEYDRVYLDAALEYWRRQQSDEDELSARPIFRM